MLNGKGVLLSLAAALVAWAGFAHAAVAQSGTAVSPPPDHTITTTDIPPQVVEDTAAVVQRMREQPIQTVITVPPLRRDHTGPWDVLTAIVDYRLDDLPVGGHDIRGLGAGFDGPTSGTVFPPDNDMAAGPSHVVVTTNSHVRFYTKTGTQTFTSSLSSFFSGLGVSGGVFDPRVVYDPDAKRWFISAIILRSSDAYSWYGVGVSDDSDPNGTWKKWAIDSTKEGSSTTNWSDFETLGASSQAVFITANMFSRTTGGYAHSNIRVIPKQQMLDFATSLTWSDLINVTTPAGGKAFAIQPAMHYGTPQAPFLADNATGSRINVYGVNNPTGTPSLTKKAVTVSSFGNPPNAGQSGTTVKLDSGDGRTANNCVWRGDSLYVCHGSTTSSYASCRWYQINTASWPSSASLTQSGTVATSGFHLFYPSIAVNKNGTVLMAFSRSGATSFPSIYYSYRKAGDATGTMTAPAAIKDGTRFYTGEGGSPVRWGDYTGTVVDGGDDTGFWHFNQYPNTSGGGSWRTWAQQISVDGGGGGTWPLDVSSDGVSGVPITVSPADTGGQKDGSTPFSRVYNDGATITLTAPSTFGSYTFNGWTLNGTPQGLDQAMTFVITSSTSAVAKYLFEPTTHIITVNSSGASSVPITVSPTDTKGQKDGTTTFTREYVEGAAVTLTAPGTFAGKTFVGWEFDGTPIGPDTEAVITADANHTMTADYSASTFTLTVTSTGESSVPITVTPADTTGQGDGITGFTRTYSSGTAVTLTAPKCYGSAFIRWVVNGVDQSAGVLTAGMTITGDTSAVATYTAPCPADFNCDGKLNINDFISFQLAWKMKDTRADFDDSGTWTINDFIAYQQAFVRGCP